jgi:hypothetical protein
MSDESNLSEHHHHHKEKGQGGNIAGGIYGMAFIGALIYFISHAASFWIGVFGVIKALFWPAFLIYHLLEFLKM